MNIEKILNNNPYIISDTHFLHENITKYANRPENWTEILLTNWNDLVKEKDYILILGDLFLGTKKNIRYFLELNPLNGKKILLIGNHDKFSDGFYNSIGIQTIRNFNQNDGIIKNAFIYKNIIFSHYPWIPIPNDMYNIHGHVHNHDFIRKENRHINVCVEKLDYCPIRLKDILNG